jgi:hypothetical protein
LRLSRAELRARFRELRNLVNTWDPIGVMADPDWPRDEYECVVGPLLHRLEKEVPMEEIGAFLHDEFTDHFGLDVSRATAMARAEAAVSWYVQRWRETERIPRGDEG